MKRCRWKFEADLCLSMIGTKKKMFHIIFFGTDMIRQYSKRAKNCKDSLDKIKYLNLNNMIVDVYVYM